MVYILSLLVHGGRRSRCHYAY